MASIAPRDDASAKRANLEIRRSPPLTPRTKIHGLLNAARKMLINTQKILQKNYAGIPVDVLPPLGFIARLTAP